MITSILIFLLPGFAVAGGVTEEDFLVNTTEQFLNLCTVSPDDPYYREAVDFCHGFLVGAYEYYEAAHTGSGGPRLECLNISAQSACVHTSLTPDNCVYEMERVIAKAMSERQSAYIVVAEDLATRPVKGPAAEPFPELKSDADELKAAVDAALAKIEAAKTGCILPAFTVSPESLQLDYSVTAS